MRPFDSEDLEAVIHTALASLFGEPRYTERYVYDLGRGYTITRTAPDHRVSYYRVLIGNTGPIVSLIPAHGGV